jgi:hypothetical protein
MEGISSEAMSLAGQLELAELCVPEARADPLRSQ